MKVAGIAGSYLLHERRFRVKNPPVHGQCVILDKCLDNVSSLNKGSMSLILDLMQTVRIC